MKKLIIILIGLISVCYAQIDEIEGTSWDNVANVEGTAVASISGIEGTEPPSSFSNTGYLEFDRSAGEWSTTDVDAALNISGSFTISFWYRFATTPSSNSAPFNLYYKASTVSDGFLIKHESDNKFKVYSESYTILATSSTFTTTNTWMYCTFVFNATTDYGYLYIDGSTVASGNFASYTDNMHSESADLGFGRYSYQSIDGDIDEMMLFDTHLPSSFHDSIGNSVTDPTSMGDPTGKYSSNLVEWFKFDEETGTTFEGEEGIVTAGRVKNSDQLTSH